MKDYARCQYSGVRQSPRQQEAAVPKNIGSHACPINTGYACPINTGYACPINTGYACPHCPRKGKG